ncbi:hypothetical protein V6N12_066606 [Hibiscus sabdariffa]
MLEAYRSRLSVVRHWVSDGANVLGSRRFQGMQLLRSIAMAGLQNQQADGFGGVSGGGGGARLADPTY